MALKYKAGDRVRIKDIDWYNNNKNNKGVIVCGSESFTHPMSYFCNKVVNIITIQDDCYRILEDDGDWYWTDEMIEGLAEEETALNKWTGLKVELELSKSVIGVSNVESLRGERFMSGFVKAIIPPEGYIFKDENGNVINATKIVLEKKKKEYPKTYEKCWYELKHDINHDKVEGYKSDILSAFQKLLICRDAYWKIAGDEMGLGKPWELSIGTPIYYIYYNRTVGTIKNDYADDIQGNIILAFPTKEMRDAFYENFKELIEIVKELL